MSEDRCELLCLDLARAEAFRDARLPAEAAHSAATRAGALADPTRLTLAATLRDAGELCVCDLAWVAERSENLVGHHLRSLREAGLASSRREHRMIFYSLTPAGRALPETVSRLVSTVDGAATPALTHESAATVAPEPAG